MYNKLLSLIFILPGMMLTACDNQKQEVHAESYQPEVEISGKTLVTFIELGSVNCIPCKQMQPVMKAIEKKYGDQIKIIFYDVWKAGQSKYAAEYKIRLIPTQVFLDKNGKEIFRHEGFFSEEEIDKFLQKQGLKINPER